MAYRNVLFDLDGTLVDSALGIEKAVESVYKKYDVPYTCLDDFRVYIGPPLRMTFAKNGFIQIEDAVSTFRDYYITKGKFEANVYAGIEELLIKLNSEGINCYVATSKPEHVAKDVLEYFHLTKYFKAIAGATLDGKRDNKDDVIRHLLSICDVQGEAIMVGDTQFDIWGAKKVGMHSVAVTWGFGENETLEEANYIVNTTDELYEVIHGV